MTKKEFLKKYNFDEKTIERIKDCNIILFNKKYLDLEFFIDEGLALEEFSLLSESWEMIRG